jgi:hypothetical protein
VGAEYPVALCDLGILAAAVAEFREVAGDRPDLLAEKAGILIGASEGKLDEPRSRAAAQWCIVGIWLVVTVLCVIVGEAISAATGNVCTYGASR